MVTVGDDRTNQVRSRATLPQRGPVFGAETLGLRVFDVTGRADLGCAHAVGSATKGRGRDLKTRPWPAQSQLVASCASVRLSQHYEVLSRVCARLRVDARQRRATESSP